MKMKNTIYLIGGILGVLSSFLSLSCNKNENASNGIKIQNENNLLAMHLISQVQHMDKECPNFDHLYLFQSSEGNDLKTKGTLSLKNQKLVQTIKERYNPTSKNFEKVDPSEAHEFLVDGKLHDFRGRINMVYCKNNTLFMLLVDPNNVEIPIKIGYSIHPETNDLTEISVYICKDCEAGKTSPISPLGSGQFLSHLPQ